jgi:glucosamine 6-phosphate synthetase-like amidotransferase/phosphosugar isomerase protein
MQQFNNILTDLLAIPKVLLKCLRYYLSPEGHDKLEFIRKSVESSGIKRIFFIGHSYNYFASMIPYYYLNSRYRSQFKSFSGNKVKKECRIFEIDEFLNYYNPCQLKDNTVFVFVSQSGNSIQIQRGIKTLLKNNVIPTNIWGVTNNPESYLAKESHVFLETKSQEEEIVGSKSYVNSIFVLFLLARAFINEEILPAKLEDEIRQLIFEIKFYGTDWEYHTKNLTEFLGPDYKFLYFISKGSSLASAYQSAQSCKAFTRTYGEGIGMGLFLRGPFQIVDDSFRCVLIIGDETSVEDTIETVELITKKLGSGKVILVNNSRTLSSLGRANPNVFVFEHTTKNTYLAPIFEIIVLQFLFLQNAKIRGVIN